jgi:hypothetical protein
METRNQDASPVGIYCRWSASTGSALGHAVVARVAEGTPAEVAACDTVAERMSGAVPHTAAVRVAGSALPVPVR